MKATMKMYAEAQVALTEVWSDEGELVACDAFHRPEDAAAWYARFGFTQDQVYATLITNEGDS